MHENVFLKFIEGDKPLIFGMPEKSQLSENKIFKLVGFYRTLPNCDRNNYFGSTEIVFLFPRAFSDDGTYNGTVMFVSKNEYFKCQIFVDYVSMLQK